MTSSERFVIDNNVVVSAVLSPRSIPRQAFDLAFMLGSVLASDSTLAELDDVLCRPKFSRYITEIVVKPTLFRGGLYDGERDANNLASIGSFAPEHTV